MSIIQKRKQRVRGSIVFLPVEEIEPNPIQPRRRFGRDGLDELAASIREHGILQPLTVRVKNEGYELIAGERRLRAASIAGLEEVPCIILNVNLEESGLIALVENLQRRDLDVIEAAEGIERLIRMFGMSREEAARRLGKSQSAIANKLRLLRLPPDVLDSMRDNELSERHGRALLRLQTPEAQRAALDYILEQNLNVAATESFIDYLVNAPEGSDEALERYLSVVTDPAPTETVPDPVPLAEPGQLANRQKTRFVLKDVRIFLNSLSRDLELMRSGGIGVALTHSETDSELVLTINISKQSERGSGSDSTHDRDDNSLPTVTRI